MIRAIFGTLAGLMLGLCLLSAGDLLSAAIYGAPSAAQMASAQALHAFMLAMPLGAKLIVLTGWALASFLGALAAAGLAKRGALPGYVVTGLLLLGGVMNFVTLPHPLWMVIAGLIVLSAPGIAAARQFASA